MCKIFKLIYFLYCFVSHIITVILKYEVYIISYMPVKVLYITCKNVLLMYCTVLFDRNIFIIIF